MVGSSIIQYVLKSYPSTRIRASYCKTEPFIKDKRIEYVKADLRNTDDCKEAVKGCDLAIMAAANTSGSKALISRPWEQINDNLAINTRLLQAFYNEGIKRIVFLGSATLYQEFEGYISEDELDLNKDPSLSYLGIGWVMRYLEKLCYFWHMQAGMNIIILRLSNIYGPYDAFHPERSHFIPALIRKAVDKMDPFEVWGNPDVIRDVLFSEDLANCIINILKHEEITFDAFNVGSGIKTSVEDVVRFAIKHSDHFPKDIKYVEDKPATITFRAIDISKIKKLTGWEPCTSVEEGIKKTALWWNDNKNTWKK